MKTVCMYLNISNFKQIQPLVGGSTAFRSYHVLYSPLHVSFLPENVYIWAQIEGPVVPGAPNNTIRLFYFQKYFVY